MKFEPFYFFLALLLGFLYVYIVAPKPDVIIKDPNPEDPSSTVYLDDSGVCYRYHKQEVKCPSNPA